MSKHRPAFSLVELLIIVVLLSVLAAMVLPTFVDATSDIDEKLAVHNLGVLRALLVRYQGQHGGRRPSASLHELLSTTNFEGQMGSGPDYRIGPYLADIPGNPLTGSSTVTVIYVDLPTVADVSGGGWLYNPATGKIWLDHSDMLGW